MTNAASHVEDTVRQPAQDMLPRLEQEKPKSQPILACADNLIFMAELPDERMKLIVTFAPLQSGEGIRIESSARLLRRSAGTRDK